MLRALTLNTIYQLIGKTISLFVGLAITYMLTRTLSKAEYGQYTILNTLIIQTASFIDWGTGFIAVRASAQKKFSTIELFSNLIYLRFFSSLVGIIIFYLFSHYNAFRVSSNLYYFGILILIPLAIKNAFLSLFQAQLKFKYFASIDTISNTMYLLFLVSITSSPTINQALTYHVTSTIFSTIIATIFAIQIFRNIKNLNTTYRLQLPIIKYLLKEALPMGAQLFIFNIYNRIDIFFLQKFHGPSAVASYGLAYKLYENLILIAAYFMNSLYPILSQSHSSQTRLIYRTSFHLLTTLAIVTMTGIAFLAPSIIHFINPSYTESVLPFQILTFALLPAYLNHLTGYTFVSIGRQVIFFYIALVALLINGIANLILIPLYSYHAAAITTVITETLISILAISYLSQYNQLYPKLTLLPKTIKTILTQPRQLFK